MQDLYDPVQIFKWKVEQERQFYRGNMGISSLHKLISRLDPGHRPVDIVTVIDQLVGLNKPDLIDVMRDYFDFCPWADKIFYVQTLLYSNVSIHDIYNALTRRSDTDHGIPAVDGALWIGGPREPNVPNPIIPTLDGTYEYFWVGAQSPEEQEQEGEGPELDPGEWFTDRERRKSIGNLHRALNRYATNYANVTRYTLEGDPRHRESTVGKLIAKYARTGELGNLIWLLTPKTTAGDHYFYYLLQTQKVGWGLYELMVVTEEPGRARGHLKISQKYLYRIPNAQRPGDDDDRTNEIDVMVANAVRIRAHKLYIELNSFWNKMGIEPTSIPKRLAALVLPFDKIRMQTLLDIESLREKFTEFIESRNMMHRSVTIRPIIVPGVVEVTPFWFMPNDSQHYWTLQPRNSLYLKMTMAGTKASYISSLREIQDCIITRDPRQLNQYRHLVRKIHNLSEGKNATSIVALTFQADANIGYVPIDGRAVTYYAVYNERYERFWERNKKLLQRIPDMDFLIPIAPIDPWIESNCTVGVHMYRYKRIEIEEYITKFEGTWTNESERDLGNMREKILTSLMEHVVPTGKKRDYKEAEFLLEQAKAFLSHSEERLDDSLLKGLQTHIPIYFNKDTINDLLTRYKNLVLIESRIRGEEEEGGEGERRRDEGAMDVGEQVRAVSGDDEEEEEGELRGNEPVEEVRGEQEDEGVEQIVEEEIEHVVVISEGVQRGSSRPQPEEEGEDSEDEETPEGLLDEGELIARSVPQEEGIDDSAMDVDVDDSTRTLTERNLAIAHGFLSYEDDDEEMHDEFQDISI